MNHTLLPWLTAQENVALAACFVGTRWRDAMAEALTKLKEMGVAHAAHALPEALNEPERRSVEQAREALYHTTEVNQ